MYESGCQQSLKTSEYHAKKKTRRYKEQDKQEVTAYLETLEAFPEKQRCYVDESGFRRYYDREYGYAPRGEKVTGESSGMNFARTNLVAGQIGGQTVAAMYYQQSTNSAVFEVWFEGRLMPRLSPGTVVILDNAQFHRKGELRKIASRYHVMVLFLPPYSPDLNPIEKLWANMKRWLKNNIRFYNSFEDALETAIDNYS